MSVCPAGLLFGSASLRRNTSHPDCGTIEIADWGVHTQPRRSCQRLREEKSS